VTQCTPRADTPREEGDGAMNQGPNRLFDEFAKLMTDAAGAAQGLRREAETAIRAQAERFLADMDLVKRDEFDAIREMAGNARAENEALKARIEALEARIAALESRKA
jgi:BMFP domain-containing protein YqiC